MNGTSGERLSRTRAAFIALVLVMLFAAPATALAKKPDKAAPAPAPAATATAGPAIDSLSTYVAAPGDQVTIYGAGFGAGGNKKTDYVSFQGGSATIVSWADTEIVVTVPNKAAPGYVSVVADDVSSNGVYFVPGNQPVVDSLSTNQASPGESVIITGQYFERKQGDGFVTFAGVQATVVSWSDTSIEVLVPEGAPAGYVGVWQTTLCSNGTFFIPGQLPAIETASAELALVGDSITITGQNFGTAPDDANSLTVSGVPASPTSWSDTSITFTVPESAQTGYIGVWRYGNNICSNGLFLLVGSRIDAASSWWGEPGGTLTVTGAGFGSTPDRVTFAGADAAVLSWEDTQIIVTIPSGVEQGYVGVWRGTTCSNGIWFLATTQPVIASVDATSAAPGQLVTIDGSNFEAQTPNSQVTMSGVDCEIVSWGDTHIVARMPGTVTEGYLGVWKYGVASNGWYLPVATTP